MSPKSFIVSSEVFSLQELKEYEECILDNKNITEREASHFFTKFPKFLTVGGYGEIVKEVVLYKGTGDYIYRVDFCRKQFGEVYWDVVELKSPKSPFIVRNGMHWKFSAQIDAGIHQALNYSDFMENDLNRLELERRTGIKLFRPKILMIGGRNDYIIDPIEMRKLLSRYHNIEIKSYEDIYSFAQDNYKTSLIVIPVIQDWNIQPSHIDEICSECGKAMYETIVDSWGGDSDGYHPRFVPGYKCPQCGNERTQD
ncbi:MAG: DUF4263 domain-containing protein [Nitrospinae bacterium]|nr:DUF4263 domain-containing protein [Nitrospinota bacterium]